MSLDEINKEVKDYEKESKELKSELFKICWYMRGSVTLEEAYNLSYDDRSIINNIVKDNLEVTKKSGLPFF